MIPARYTTQAAAATEKPCTTHADGKYYDISPLSSKIDYDFKTPGGYEGHINVCHSALSESWNLKVPNPQDVGGFIRKDHGDFSMGNINSTLAISDGNPLLTFSSGSSCPTTTNLQASTAIRFICDTSVSIGKPTLITQLPPTDSEACSFFMEWRTKHACPKSEGSSFFGFVGGTIVLSLLAYLMLGTLYNRYVLHLSGTDQIPRFSLKSARYHLSSAWEMAQEWWEDIQSRRGVSLSEGRGNWDRTINPSSHQWMHGPHSASATTEGEPTPRAGGWTHAPSHPGTEQPPPLPVKSPRHLASTSPPSHSSNPSPQIKPTRRFGSASSDVPPTPREREFVVGSGSDAGSEVDDEEYEEYEEARELGEVRTPVVVAGLAAAQAAAQGTGVGQGQGAGAGQGGQGGQGVSQSAVVERGREGMEGEGVIRL